jgi:hypothetical protein
MVGSMPMVTTTGLDFSTDTKVGLEDQQCESAQEGEPPAAKSAAFFRRER